MRYLYKLAFCFIFVFVLILFPQISKAEEKINNFDVSIVAHIDGSMTVQENIDYDFGEDFRHGIFRDIPTISEVGDLYRVVDIDVENVKRDGKDEKFEVDNTPEEVSIKIGDPEETIDGAHNYIIIYKVKNGIGSNYEDHDEIYWNATGNNWDIPIEKASANITTDFGVATNRAVCFTRSAEFNAQFCTFDASTFNPVTTTNVMQPGEGLTVVYGFPANTFPDSILRKDKPFWDPDFLSFLKIYFVVWIGLNFLLAPYLLFRYFSNRPKTFEKVSVNFDLPKYNNKLIPPAEAGIIDNTKLEQNDVIATIFDLAIRKYIKIEDVKIDKKFQPDEKDYKIIKLKDYGDLKEYEKTLLDRFFKDNNSILLKELKTDFYLTFAKMEKEVYSSLTDDKFYVKNPKDTKATLLVFGIILLFGANILLGPVLIFLSSVLNGRTALGDKFDAQVEGLKMFLKSVDRYHKFQSKNLITVEKYIPYAIAFGMQEEFMKQLKVIYPDYQAGWYSGNGFYHSYSGMYRSFSYNTTVAVGSSSGFSGGGSSGGGGGGGGGGSW